MTDEAPETFEHNITEPLSPEEIHAYEHQVAELDREIIKTEGEKALASAKFNEELKASKKARNALLESISTGVKQVPVQAYHERDDRRGMMLTLRVGSGDVLDERALTAEERKETPDDRQGDLFADKSAPPDLPGDDEDEYEGDADAEAALEEYAAERAAATLPTDDVEEEGVGVH